MDYSTGTIMFFRPIAPFIHQQFHIHSNSVAFSLAVYSPSLFPTYLLFLDHAFTDIAYSDPS